jgi:hypothetical protein
MNLDVACGLAARALRAAAAAEAAPELDSASSELPNISGRDAKYLTSNKRRQPARCWRSLVQKREKRVLFVRTEVREYHEKMVIIKRGRLFLACAHPLLSESLKSGKLGQSFDRAKR